MVVVVRGRPRTKRRQQCAFFVHLFQCVFFMWTKEEEQKRPYGRLNLRCEKSSPPFLFLIRIFTRTFSFAFSAARTSHIALHSTHNVCLVCTIVRGFREVRRNRFASDRASPRYDFPFSLFLFFCENRIGKIGRATQREKPPPFEGEKCQVRRISPRPRLKVPKNSPSRLSRSRNAVVHRKQTSKRASFKVRAEVRAVVSFARAHKATRFVF